ncbi:MAG: flagellar FliJ family protein [Proteobacteria bacterium]|nr:flagellar FliJ family protein [Pseudomonadota bacterium]RTL30984.1 MAG: flagellar export protein FliJ [Rhodocyclaceae bacterium]
MSAHPKTLRGLAAVVDQRRREKDSLVGELAARRTQLERHRATLARLEQLCASATVSGERPATHVAALSLNCGDYKQAVLHLADSQRGEVERHDADLQLAQLALTRAVQRHEAVSQVLDGKLQALQREQRQGEQKRQDELATQSWWRGRA